MEIDVIVPTLNAAVDLARLIPSLLLAISPRRVLIVDSSSDDNTVAIAERAGFRTVVIPRSEFNHGRTRQLASEMCPSADVLVYMTQDAMLFDCTAITTLVSVFESPHVSAAFGRQLPRPGATPIEAHARLYNYPADSMMKDLSSRERLGIKTVFISNSFAAYRRRDLVDIGGFPSAVILGEDTVVAAKLILRGSTVAYMSEAKVYHSHSYSLRQEFRRYFDIGVLHRRESWLKLTFGSAGGEGARFVFSELRYLWPRHLWLIPSATLRTILKLCGYRLGLREHHFSPWVKRFLSMHRSFWGAR